MKPIFLAFILVSLSSSKAFALDPEKWNFPYHQEIVFKSMYAIDGDTLSSGKWRIRLASIDAPEIGQLCYNKVGQEYQCGVMAKKYLQNLLDRSVEGIVCTLEKRDKYNRIIASCKDYKSGKYFDDEMLKAGQAIYGYIGRNRYQDYAKKIKLVSGLESSSNPGSGESINHKNNFYLT